MAKGQKPSASSGTRKKNARKAAQAAQGSSSTAPPPSPVPKPPKAKTGKAGKLSKREAREQRKKVYIPPTKPAPPVRDPLDTTGLAHLLPPELVVVLRALGKKDVVTRGKAIEELARWIDEAIREEAAKDRDLGPYEEDTYAKKANIVVKMLPVWVRVLSPRSCIESVISCSTIAPDSSYPSSIAPQYSSLTLHGRIRYLSSAFQLSILRLTPTREALIAWVTETASQGELETVLGTWAMLAHDIDSGVASVGIKSWTEFLNTTTISGADTQSQPRAGSISQLKLMLTPALLVSLFLFAHSTVLDPHALHMSLNPGPVAAPAVPTVQEYTPQGKKDAPQGKERKDVPQGKSAPKGKSVPQGKGGGQGKKGAYTPPQPQQRKSARYIPPPESSPGFPSPQPDRGTGDNASEENDSDRAGRLRVAALGVVRWILENFVSFDSMTATASPVVPTVTTLLSSPAFWSTLHPGSVASNDIHQTCPFAAVSFGQNQPQVRQAAWALVGSLVRGVKGSLPASLVRILSTAVLRSAWVETDVGVRAVLGAPLVLFLRDYPHAWEIDAASSIRTTKDHEDTGVKDNDGDDSNSSSESDPESESGCESEESDDGEVFEDAQEDTPNESLSNQQLQMPGRRSQAYTEFLQFLELACSGSPVDGYPMVLVVIAGIPKSIFPASLPPTSLVTDTKMDDGSEAHPVTQLLTSFWAPLDARLLDRRAVASAWLKALLECLVFIREDAKALLTAQFSRLWSDLATRKLRVEDMEAARIVASALGRVVKLGDDLFDASFSALSFSIVDPVQSSDSILDLAPTFLHRRYIQRIVEALESPDRTATENALKDPLQLSSKSWTRSDPRSFDDASFAFRIDALFLAHPVELLQASEQAVLAYLRHRSGVIDPKRKHLVDGAVATGDPGAGETTVAKVLGVPAPLLSSTGLATIASILSNSIAGFAESRIKAAGVPSAQLGDLEELVEAGLVVRLVKQLVGSGYEFRGDVGVELYVGVFILAFVIPCKGEEHGGYKGKVVEDAMALWSSWASKDGEMEYEMREVVGGLVKERLRAVVIDDKVETRSVITFISPASIIVFASSLILVSTLLFLPPIQSRALSSAASAPPQQASSTTPCSILTPSPLHVFRRALALLDPTLPTSSSALTRANSTRTAYTRATSALLAHLSTSRTVARSNLWALRHVLVLGFYANEYLRVEDARSGIFTVDGRKEDVKEVVEKVKSLTTYLLGWVEEGVHGKAVSVLMGKNASVPRDDGSLAAFVIEVVQHAKEKDRVRDAAVLRKVLQHLFSDATKDDADLWLGLARRLEKTAPQTAITILTSITAYAPEPPKLDRYRNELAASLLGVRLSAAPATGLTTLRLLAATAPDPESDVVFLPQQRAVNVMKACQTEDVESAMTLLFIHLAPILQSVPGAHWTFIWDVVENNLGGQSKLVMTIEDLASTNKPLRADWEERKSLVLGLIRDIVTVDTRTMPYSEPRALCRELALSVIQDIPSTMMSEKTLPTMCHLLVDQSQEVQRLGYHLLQNAARVRTEHYVIESAVDTEDTVKPELPTELLAILQQSLGSGEALDMDDQLTTCNMEVSGYLLAWMTMFDLFTGASSKVRSSYFNHMRSLDIISQRFIPNVFDVLGLFSGGKQVLKLDVWAVDEFYLDTFDPESSVSLRLLAAHLYHRALLTVPALIRSWISDCTDKQLLTRVVRQPDAASELATIGEPERQSLARLWRSDGGVHGGRAGPRIITPDAE
ncbi:hypothetical protein BU15DRAFT_74748 [Melanogaster broomeanus]|nr:hypothetical protein BU15DRAFT_74748 [Melanogaster broomeanus]